MAAGRTSLPTYTSLSGPPVEILSEEKTNGTRLTRLLKDEGAIALRNFLHFTHPGPTLKFALDNNRPKLEGLKRKRIIPDEQWEKLFPSSGNPPNPQIFDVTLLHLLLREVCHLKTPSTGWHKMPADADASPEASIVRLKCFRNELCHSDSTGVPNDEFQDKWNKISSSLEVLEVAAYRKKLQFQKNASIDHKAWLLGVELEQWRREKELEKSGKDSELSSCLPDEMSEEEIIGRGETIQDIKDKVQSGTVPVIQITGGPGFGKTTVAKRVACELARGEDRRTVFFCSLLSKKTFNEVTMEMFNSCSKVVDRQVPENPGQWLKSWSKQIQDQVTFVLDNADGVLKSPNREAFLEILRDMRRLSRRNVTFVITTRSTFEDPDLPSEEVRLPRLSKDQARNLLVSRVCSYQLDAQHELCKVEQLVTLCDGVPLALCIVGSLLSNVTEETLIKNLKREPLAVLEDGQRSVEIAIKTSFDFLTEAEQEAFVLMSTFQGSFSSVAAEAVMKASSNPGIRPIKIIRSLKESSLIEQPSPRRYQMHPLIHSYARKIGQENYPDLLEGGEKLVCVHFISCLINNANMYWRKDTCKDSVHLFDEDRDNFEYFLHIYTQKRKKQDEEIMECSRTFLESFPQKGMYLQKCLPPKIYAYILEQLMDTFDSVLEPVHFVELSCLLGHEYRKEDTKKYNELMQKAKEIYNSNTGEFHQNPLAEVYFHNSYARFLSNKKDPSDHEKKRIEEENQIALDICYARLGDLHPQTAATLLITGQCAKEPRHHDLREERLKKALEIFRRVLGKHFMTAETLKAIADSLIRSDENGCHRYYEETLEMLDCLGAGESKESILPLKNYGSCLTASGNLDKAMELLMKAEKIAERELKPNHNWRVSIKTSLALLHDKMGNVEVAKNAMLEGLSMHIELGLPIDKIGNKVMIRKFMSRYPETFPKAEFPRNTSS